MRFPLPKTNTTYYIWRTIIMGMLDISIVKKYIRMADDGWHQG